MSRATLWVIGLLVVAGGAGATVWVRTRAEKPVDVTGVAVSQGPIEAFVKATGVVETQQDYTIAAPQSARLVMLAAQVGNTVKRGATIAQLDAAPVAERLRSAQAQLAVQESQIRQAQMDLRAEESIWRAGGQTRQTVDLAESKLAVERSRREVAQSDVRAAQLLQQTYVVLAPADGVVTSVTARAGEFVQAGTPLLTLASQAGFEVRIRVDQASADQIQVGQAVELSAGDAPGVVGRTRISRIEPRMQKDGSSYYLVARAPLPADVPAARLNQQFTARILSASKPAALRVPLDAVTEQDGADVVRVIVDGRLRMQPVKTGIQDGQQIEILQGLVAGQQVVFGNVRQPLTAGTLVKLTGNAPP